MQKSDARYVANARRWQKDHGRSVKAGARPLIILVPFGPVDFVYDVQDTEGTPVPESAMDFFGASGRLPAVVWERTKTNANRDFIAVTEEEKPRNEAGVISTARAGQTVTISKGHKSGSDDIRPARYAIALNRHHSDVTQYATLAHELAHLYCGHLGTPDEKWWPDRRHVERQAREFEAESVSWLVCERLGIENPSARYLDGYLSENSEVPVVSLDLVLKVAGHIERMGREVLKMRKER